MELLDRTPDPDVYTILRVEAVGSWLVMMVQYPSCKKCSFDARKVLVFANTEIKDVVFWKRIDPHFQEQKPKTSTEAPAPRGRFPADDEGWADALAYARSKSGSRR